MPEDQAGDLFLLIEDRMLNASADTRGSKHNIPDTALGTSTGKSCTDEVKLANI